MKVTAACMLENGSMAKSVVLLNKCHFNGSLSTSRRVVQSRDLKDSRL